MTSNHQLADLCASLREVADEIDEGYAERYHRRQGLMYTQDMRRAARAIDDLCAEVERLRALMADCAESLRIATTFHYARDDAERMDAIITRMSDEVGAVINRLDPIDGPADVAPAVPTKPWMPDRYLDESGDTAETPVAPHVHTFVMGVCACGERSDVYLQY